VAPTTQLPPPVNLAKLPDRRRQSRQVPSFLYKIQQSINVLSLSLHSHIAVKYALPIRAIVSSVAKRKAPPGWKDPADDSALSILDKSLFYCFSNRCLSLTFSFCHPSSGVLGFLFIIMQQMSRRVEIMEENNGEGTS